jgi:hypothetical protein
VKNGSSLLLTVSTGTAAHCVYRYSRSLYCCSPEVQPLSVSTGTAASCTVAHRVYRCTFAHCVYRYSSSLCLQVQPAYTTYRYTVASSLCTQGTAAHFVDGVFKYSRTLCLQVQSFTVSPGIATHSVYRYSRSLRLRVQPTRRVY